jgi:hypothetical protein
MVNISAKQYEKIRKYKRIIDKHRQNLTNAKQNKNIDEFAKECSQLDYFMNEYLNYMNTIMPPNRFYPIDPPTPTTPATDTRPPTEALLDYYAKLATQLCNNELTYTFS